MLFIIIYQMVSYTENCTNTGVIFSLKDSMNTVEFFKLRDFTPMNYLKNQFKYSLLSSLLKNSRVLIERTWSIHSDLIEWMPA